MNSLDVSPHKEKFEKADYLEMSHENTMSSKMFPRRSYSLPLSPITPINYSEKVWNPGPPSPKY